MPIPGSPASRNSRPRPATASSTPARSSAISRPRPTNTAPAGASGGRGRRRIQRGVLLEDGLLQLPQPRARLDAELADERAARRLVCLERIGLATGPVQRHQQLRAQALAQRVLGDQRLELGHELRAAPEREIGVEAVLERHQPQLLQAGDLALAERLEREVGQRRAAPQRERLAQRPRGRPPIWSRARRGEEPLEAVQVERVRPEPQLVARRPRHDDPVPVAVPGGLERPPEPGHRHRERLERVAALGARPQLLEQPVAGDRLAGVQEQQRQQRPLLDAPERELPAADPRLERPQDEEFHGWAAAERNTGDRPSASRCRAVDPLLPPRWMVAGSRTQEEVHDGHRSTPRPAGGGDPPRPPSRDARRARRRRRAARHRPHAGGGGGGPTGRRPRSRRRRSRPPLSPFGLRYDGGPEEGSRGAGAGSQPNPGRPDGGPEEGTRGPGH